MAGLHISGFRELIRSFEKETEVADYSGSMMTTLSTPRTGSYYIYSFDGRLLAEYDIYGTCLRDYIYMGSRLVAEYVPASGQYFYYVQDQIGSTRVVTNDAGAVVYAEAGDSRVSNNVAEVFFRTQDVDRVKASPGYVNFNHPYTSARMAMVGAYLPAYAPKDSTLWIYKERVP